MAVPVGRADNGPLDTPRAEAFQQLEIPARRQVGDVSERRYIVEPHVRAHATRG